ncbi:MAG: bile acid:sodium symporter family protein [Novosphingobium sp.]
MRAILKSFADPFLLALLGSVVLASLLPCSGRGAAVFGALANAGIVLLFFLHGAKLSREAIVAGARNWRLHLVVLAFSYMVFPALGLGMTRLLPLPAVIATGLLFLTLLPSTVQSSIAFTALARGNVAAAVCSASLSNLLGVVLTPLLVSLLMSRSGASVGLGAIEKVALQLVLPFALGHLSRPRIVNLLARHKPIVGLVDRGAILLVVYTSFSAAVIEGLWHRLSPLLLAEVIGLSVLLLTAVLALTRAAGKLGGFSREDAIVILFCGSKKSLVSGVPLAGVLFPPAQVGLVVLPLMVFHQLQLIACAVIARHYADAAERSDSPHLQPSSPRP